MMKHFQNMQIKQEDWRGSNETIISRNPIKKMKPKSLTTSGIASSKPALGKFEKGFSTGSLSAKKSSLKS